MIDAGGGGLALLLACLGGMLIGLGYFGALWWAVRRIASFRHPALLIGGTFLLRAVGAAAGIVLVSGGEIVRLLVAVGGFLAARTLLTRIVGRPLASVTAVGGGMPPEAGAEPLGRR